MNIEFANERNFENVVTEFESRDTGRIRNVSNSLSAVLRETHFDHLRQAIFGDLNGIRIVAVYDDHTVLRNNIQQAPKAELDLIEIVEDIRVIEASRGRVEGHAAGLARPRGLLRLPGEPPGGRVGERA